MKVLLAVDESRYSESAAEALVQQIPPEKAEVCIFHAVDLQLPIPTSDAEAFRQESMRQGNELAHRIERFLKKAGYKTQTVVQEGYPKSLIVDYAARWGADLIVVGTHGRKGVNRFLMGSVAESVSRHAPCSVLVVRHIFIG